MAAVSLALASTVPCGSQALVVPAGAEVLADADLGRTRVRIATAPWAPGGVPAIEAEGLARQTAYRLSPSDATPLDLAVPYRAALLAEGYDILLDCGGASCGGFDFRYGIPILPEPRMHVDLSDFHYVSARRLDDGAHASVLTSRTADAGYVQIIRVVPAADPPPAAAAPGIAVPERTADPLPQPAAQVASLADLLERNGRVLLDDLVFQTASASLETGEFASLAALAAYLDGAPGRKIVLVGHTDAVGELAINMSLSERRAAAVRDRLVRDFGVNPAQVSAAGAGWLAPRASNLTEEGRAQNRRVEAILTSTR